MSFDKYEPSPWEAGKDEEINNGNPDIAAQGENVDNPNRSKQKTTSEDMANSSTYARNLEQIHREEESRENEVTRPTPEELLALMGVESKTTQGVNSDARQSSDIDGASKEAIQA